MRQAIIGVSIFFGLQIVYALVLFGLTKWEGRQLDRPTARSTSGPRAVRAPQSLPVPSDDEDLPLSA